MPDSLSVHLNFAVTTLSERDRPRRRPGVVMFTDGFTASALNAISFVASTRPGVVGRLELDEVVPGREAGERAGVGLPRRPPSSLYSMWSIPDPCPSSPVSVTVGDAYQPFCGAGRSATPTRSGRRGRPSVTGFGTSTLPAASVDRNGTVRAARDRRPC